MDDFFAEVETRQPSWPAGRPDLHIHCLFDPDLIDKTLVEPYRVITHRPGLAPVSAQWVHMTVLHGGPVGDYQDGEIDTIVHLLRQRCAGIAPFDITFDRPQIGSVAVGCVGRPGEPAQRLWELSAQVNAEVAGDRFPLIPAGYYPHMSLAYGVGGPQRADRTAMKILMSDHPGEPVTLRVQALSVVAQSHNRRYITWTPIAEVPLGG